MRSGVVKGKGEGKGEGRNALCFHVEPEKCVRSRDSVVVCLDAQRFLADHPMATFFETIPTHLGKQRDGLKTYGLPAPEQWGKEHSYIPPEYFTIVEKPPVALII